jgi:hypothetical protein
MRGLVKVLGWSSVTGLLFLFPPNSGAELLGSMRVNLLQGDVQVRIAETGEWAPASINMPLLEGDELWVPEGSRAAFQTNHGAHVRLDANSALQVLRMDRRSFQFHLAQGDAYVLLNRAPKRSVLQFDTPDASIRAFGSSTFRIEVPGGETDVSVYRGSVQTESADGTTQVRAGDLLALGADGFTELSPLPPPDDWQRWNVQRDRAVLARGESYRYLPAELRTYSGDFDAGGRWVYVPEYGYCWTPTVVVIRDWAPYRHGRWVWRGGDYVWIGYEPWGWAPYHYGRWAFTVNFGWFWVPPPRGEVFWAPGYVGWVRTGDYVAWVPLAPREIYYGHGHYGRYSVNVTNVNIQQVHVTNVYRNANVSDSVTVVHQTTFVTGRHAPVDRTVVSNARDDFARRRNIVVGRPPIRPAESSYVPVVRPIPEAKRPPERVRKVDSKELKQSRPLVTEPKRSVIRPQAAPPPLEVRKVDTPRNASERARERPAGQGRGIEQGKPREAPAGTRKPEAPPGRGKAGAPPGNGKAVTPRSETAPAVEKGRPPEPPKERERAKPPARQEREKPEPPDGGNKEEGDKGRPDRPPDKENQGSGR